MADKKKIAKNVVKGTAAVYTLGGSLLAEKAAKKAINKIIA